MEKIICEKCNGQNFNNAKYCSSCGCALPKVEQPPVPFSAVPPAGKTYDLKKILFAVLGVVVFGLAYFGVQQIFKRPSFDSSMMQMASDLNKQCPIMVDQHTRLDNAIALSGNIFQYNYTLVNFLKADINIDTLKKYMEPGILNNIKTNPDLENFRKNRTTLNYCYKDKNGVFVHKYTVTPQDYLNE
jgi:hypothetical protein